MEKCNIFERIERADMVLVGLGEEFDDMKRLRQDPTWRRGREFLQEVGGCWLLPAWNEYCSGRLGEDAVTPALERLIELLEGKNFFLAAVSTNDAVNRELGGGKRLVMPCGGAWMKQCAKGCEEELYPVTQEDWRILEDLFYELYQGQIPVEIGLPALGYCSQCGIGMVLNNVYADRYNENGYLDNWGRYTKWLQGTLNHSLLVLELGVRMDFPSVIRWPFEKVVRYNQRAFLYRVNEDLYQLPEDLSSKGCGISKNTIDWLRQL